MAYVTLQQLKDRLGQSLYDRLTDRVSGTKGDDAIGQDILEEAEALVHSYLARRYATPIDLAQHPELADVLAARTLDVAEYLAWRGSPFVSDLPDRVEQLHEQATRWLEQIAAGRVDLPAAAPPRSRVSADDGPRYQATARKFTADELDGL